MNFNLYLPTTRKEFIETQHELSRIKSFNDEVAKFIEEIGQGNFEAEISENLLQNTLGNSLLAMKQYLVKIAEDEKKRNWLNSGLATFSDILRNKNSLSLKDLTDEILTNLVKYLDANQGAVFIIEESENQDPILRALSCYAYNRKKYIDKIIEMGDGLAGQCALEKEIIYLTEVPADYVKITSGLGAATPRSILLAPLLLNEQIYGVLELASLNEFQPHHIEFINKLSENIAATVKNVKDSERNLHLLNLSQQQTEELKSQEEEMRQNMEEMQATQEEMSRMSDELNKAQEQVFEGLNSTTAIIEFHPDGTIIKANEMFLNSMGYSLNMIQGHHHKMFVPQDILLSNEYQNFWKSLAMGQAFDGLFRRKTSEGKIVWLKAIYNPIKNKEGKVIKVIKFATDATTEQELIAESNGIKEGINSTMATIEFKPDGTILNANENFLQTVGYSLIEIQGKHHSIFVPKDILESHDYKTFWSRLAAGESMTGVFQRISAEGKHIRLNAIYNPIKNSTGEVYKVIKFATDITAEQELITESHGILEGINATMATIEFTPDGNILKANDKFLDTMKYPLSEIKGKHHRIFVPQDLLNGDYENFWKNLASGKPSTGIFERQNSNGEKIKLNAIYNPIKNINGEVTKVIKFANVLTN